MLEIERQNELGFLCCAHTEVHNGIEPIDGHFETAVKQISKFCAAGKYIVASLDILNALRGCCGALNSSAEMVAIN